jgi:hypothetical protein
LKNSPINNACSGITTLLYFGEQESLLLRISFSMISYTSCGSSNSTCQAISVLIAFKILIHGYCPYFMNEIVAQDGREWFSLCGWLLSVNVTYGAMRDDTFLFVI